MNSGCDWIQRRPGSTSPDHAWKVEYSSKPRGVGNPWERATEFMTATKAPMRERSPAQLASCLHLSVLPRSEFDVRPVNSSNLGLGKLKVRDIFVMDDGLRPVRYDTVLALEQLANADAKLGALIARVGPFALRVKSTHSPFEALLESILYQQLHANAAKAILGRLLAGFGDLHPQPEQLLAAPEEMLRAAGLSRSKLLSLRDLAAKTLDGTVPRWPLSGACPMRRSSSGSARYAELGPGPRRCCSSFAWAGPTSFLERITESVRVIC